MLKPKPDNVIDGILDIFYDCAAAALADVTGDEHQADDHLCAARARLETVDALWLASLVEVPA